MPSVSVKKTPARKPKAGAATYRGSQTRTGNSLGFRFEGALFKSHPEFNGEVRASVIAPGRMLITAEPASVEKADPVIASFLAFLSADMTRAPQEIRPLDAALIKRMARLTKGVRVSPEENLGDEGLLSA